MRTFDADGYVREGLAMFYKYLEEFAEKIAADMKASMTGSTRAVQWFKSDVERHVKTKMMREGNKFNCLIGLIDADESIYYKGFIMAYGSGVHINKKDNPWFDDFLTGSYDGAKYWNIMRPASNAITYRPLGERYYDFFHNTFAEGHGPDSKGNFRSLPLMSFEAQDTPWFNRAVELNGVNNKEYINKKVEELMIRAFNEVSANKYFK